MFRGIYSAATGMEIANRNLDIDSNNLANTTQAGFRQRGLVFETFEAALAKVGVTELPVRVGAQVSQDYTDFRAGPLERTGAPLDLAIAGDGFFVLQGPNGDVFSRDGVFLRNAEGQLVNTGGLPVLGNRGVIILPPNATNIVVASDGSVAADGVIIDRLQIASFGDPRQLEPVGTALYRAGPNARRGVSNASVLQGVREQSNLQPATAMVSLIRDLRYFEASQRALRAQSDTMQLVTRPNQ